MDHILYSLCDEWQQSLSGQHTEVSLQPWANSSRNILHEICEQIGYQFWYALVFPLERVLTIILPSHFLNDKFCFLGFYYYFTGKLPYLTYYFYVYVSPSLPNKSGRVILFQLPGLLVLHYNFVGTIWFTIFHQNTYSSTFLCPCVT